MYKMRYLLVSLFLMVFMLSSCSKTNKYTYRDNGIQQLEEGNYVEAVASFNEAINKSSGRVGKFEKDVLKYRAEAEFKSGDYEAAAKSYETLLEVDKNLPEYEYMKQISLGQVYEASEDYSNAMVAYESAVAAKGGSADVYNRIGMCKIKEKEYEEALSYFQKGIELQEEDILPLLLYHEAVTYEKLEDFHTALTKFESYVGAYGSNEALEKELTFLRTR